MQQARRNSDVSIHISIINVSIWAGRETVDVGSWVKAYRPPHLRFSALSVAAAAVADVNGYITRGGLTL